MFIQTESTPNPATLKFLPGRSVSTSGPIEFRDPSSCSRSPLAERLFAIQGVSAVFFGSDFISVTKRDGEWAQLKPQILSAVMEHFTSGAPVLVSDEEAGAATESYSPEDLEIVDQIKELLETRIRPAVANDGGDIIFRGFDRPSGTVFLSLRGACAGCPSSTATLKNGIENLLRHYVPEVNAVESVAA